MNETNEMWRAWKAEKSKIRETDYEKFKRKMIENCLRLGVHCQSDRTHKRLRIHSAIDSKKWDYWPGSGKWQVVGEKKVNRGFGRILSQLTKHKKPNP